jgi:hypothetical protein
LQTAGRADGMQTRKPLYERTGAAAVLWSCCSLRAADVVARDGISVAIMHISLCFMITWDKTHRAAFPISKCPSDLFATGRSDVVARLREVAGDR